jgi:hypothetical protein
LNKIFSGGSPLTRDESKATYAVVCYNFRTYAPGGVVAVVKGRENGENIIKQYEAAQSAAERQEGWRCFLERTDMKPGLDPQEATNLRQSSLDMRESENQA